MEKKRKRLEVLVPEEHPIWRVPKGSRTAFVVACLDLGTRMEEILAVVDARFATIEGRLVSLEEALVRMGARLEEALAGGRPAEPGVRPGEGETATIPDPDGFLAAFE
ncbi:hypothetical protein G7K71_02900 [Desulfofundulus sp. TPOSR]|uniref:hypothetical protein n=1 Tax=Desulfofundulus sp. TPOSR TaxID=2714340 RepID=UPI00140AF610|nr:hypothetical protein [Desulfofundulus sp. TPOSR]NHM25975.1 hypothetical protein [Desulfofundulus sp. TPOSR]